MPIPRHCYILLTLFFIKLLKMGELLRSEAVEKIQLIVQSDAAYDTIDEIGKLEAVQFVDVLL